MGFWWALPFAGLLLSVAVVQQLSPRFWRRHFGKVAAACAMLFLLAGLEEKRLLRTLPQQRQFEFAEAALHSQEQAVIDEDGVYDRSCWCPYLLVFDTKSR